MTYEIIIDGRSYFADRPMLRGSDVRAIPSPPIPVRFALWFGGENPTRLSDDMMVDLRDWEDPPEFYSRPRDEEAPRLLP